MAPVRSFGALALSLAVFAPSAGAADEPRYVLEDLGVGSVANALGPKSWPVGRHSNLAAYYADGIWVQLKTRSKYNASEAKGANRFGHSVGYESAMVGYRPVHWTPDGIRHVIDLPGDDDRTVGWAVGVSRDGLVAGKYSVSMDNWDEYESCFIARPGEEAFDPAPDAYFCQVGGVNAHGMVAGGGVTDQGFIWHEGQMTTFGPLPGYTWTQPQSINDAGHVVGWTSSRHLKQVGFLWDGSQIRKLGTLDDGPWAYLKSINNRGQIVGNGETPTDGSRALIVIAGRMERLEKYVLNADGWVLSTANQIDDHGVIVGSAQYQGGTHAYRLTPVHDKR